MYVHTHTTLSISPVALPILWIKDREKGMGWFIFRKKQAGRSTQLELVTEEKDGVLKHTHTQSWLKHLLLLHTDERRFRPWCVRVLQFLVWY